MLKDLPQYHQGTAAEANARKLLATKIKNTLLIDALCAGFRLSDLLTANINETLSTKLKQEGQREFDFVIQRTTPDNKVWMSIRVFNTLPEDLEPTYVRRSHPFQELVLSAKTIARICADSGAIELTLKTTPSERVYYIPGKAGINVIVNVLCEPSTNNNLLSA